MEQINSADVTSDDISIHRCRELLGDDADGLSDQEIDQIRRQAGTMAHVQYCRLHRGRVQFVVVFNLTRFAREKYDHFALRAHLKSLGISLPSATEPIDDTSTVAGGGSENPAFR